MIIVTQCRSCPTIWNTSWPPSSPTCRESFDKVASSHCRRDSSSGLACAWRTARRSSGGRPRIGSSTPYNAPIRCNASRATGAGIGAGPGQDQDGARVDDVRDDRPAGDTAAPAVWFAYSPDRKGEHPAPHLETFRGTQQPDAYAGFNQLYEDGRIEPAACWAKKASTESRGRRLQIPLGGCPSIRTKALSRDTSALGSTMVNCCLDLQRFPLDPQQARRFSQC